MAATAGYLSYVKVGTVTINNIKSQDMPLKIAALDTTSFSASVAGTESYIGGLLSGQLKFSGQYDKGDTGQATVETNFLARTVTPFTFSPDNSHTYAASCLITGYNVKSDVKGLVTADFELQLSGTVTAA
jgi:Phage tail tube protein